LWDVRNRLQSITLPNAKTLSFKYDFAGNLISRTVTTPTSTFTQNFLLDDLTNVVHESDSNNNQFSILTGRSIDQHLAISDSNGNVEFGIFDAINSTTATVDQDGIVKNRFLYEPFGQTTTFATDHLFQYTGRMPVTQNLYYNRARYYDSVNGQFISEDPIGFAGQDFNLYRYVRNDPLNRIDPTGEFPVLIAIAAVVSGTAKALETSQECNATVKDVLLSFAIGAVSGGVGAAIPIPGVSGLVSDLVEQGLDKALRGEEFDGTELVISATVDAINPAGLLGIKTRGRLPQSLTSKVGKNTVRLFGQEAVNTLTEQAVGSAVNHSSKCGCK
jgi:RHS repeat-associated protein